MTAPAGRRVDGWQQAVGSFRKARLADAFFSRGVGGGPFAAGSKV